MKKERDMSVNAKLTLPEYFAMGSGSGGILLLGSISGVLLVYYTYVMGISAGLASSIIAASRLFDGVSDVIAGRIIDRTHTKYGKARPWILRMIIPAVISVLACFLVPVRWGTTAQVVYIFVTYNMSTTVCVTMLSIALSTLNGLVTLDQKSRGNNGAVFMIAQTIVSTAFTVTYLHLAKFFGNGEQYTQVGWVKTMVVYSIFSIALLFICFLGVRERVVEKQEESIENGNGLEPLLAENEISVFETVKSLLRNKYWVICLFVAFGSQIIVQLIGSMGVYFADQILGDVNLQAQLAVAGTIGTLPALFVVIPLMIKLGKRNVCMLGVSIAGLSSLLPLISKSLVVCMLCLAGRGFGIGLAGATITGLVMDSLTYGLWKNGFLSMGIGNSINSMANKIGQAGGAVIMGVLLECSGYVSGAATQSAGVRFVIFGMFSWIPFIFLMGLAILMYFYKLDKIYPEIQSDLNERKYAETAYKFADKIRNKKSAS